MIDIAAVVTRHNEVAYKEIENLMEEAEVHIMGEDREAFKRQMELTRLDSNIRLIEALDKEASTFSEKGSAGIAGRLRELRGKSEIWKRRFQLLRAPIKQEFEATLMWMAERGVKDDLELLRQVEKNPPYSSAKIRRLLESAKERVSKRVYGSDKDLQDFFGLSQTELAGITQESGAKEKLRSMKESLEGLFEAEEIRRWLHTPKSIYAGKTPVEMIIGGESDYISEILVRLEEGSHN